MDTIHAHAAETHTPTRRKRGSGSFVKKGRVWYFRLPSGERDAKGRTRYAVRCLGTGDRREAEERARAFAVEAAKMRDADYLAGRLARVRGELDALRDAAPALPLSDAFRVYAASLERGRVADKTLSVLQQRFGIFRRWAATAYPDAVEVRHVSQEVAAAFMRMVAARWKPGTFNAYRATFAALWDTLAKEGARTPCNPWREIRAMPIPPSARRELTVEELRRVAGAVSGEMRVLFALGVYTGLRLGDAACLDWGAVDLARGFVSVLPAKTARHGTRVRIPIAAPLAAILEETPPAKRRGPVLPALAAEYRDSKQALSRRVQAAFRAAGIETHAKADRGRNAVAVGFHSMRHTFVSLCANSGVPLAVVQSIVGHTSAAMTRHYFHVSDAALSGAARALPAIGAAPPAVEAPETPLERAPRPLPGSGGATGRAARPGASTALLRAFAALLAKMDAADRREAARMLAQADAGAVEAATAGAAAGKGACRA